MKKVTEEDREEERMAEEDLIRERVDEKGNIWRKVYFGGGAHFRNWLDQTTELCGEENVPFRYMIAALDTCRRADLKRVAFAAKGGDR